MSHLRLPEWLGLFLTNIGRHRAGDNSLCQHIYKGHFELLGLYRKRLRYFVDGLAVGSDSFIREQLARLREAGHYLRRRHPIPQLGGIHLSLREQRSTAVSF